MGVFLDSLASRVGHKTVSLVAYNRMAACSRMVEGSPLEAYSRMAADSQMAAYNHLAVGNHLGACNRVLGVGSQILAVCRVQGHMDQVYRNIPEGDTGPVPVDRGPVQEDKDHDHMGQVPGDMGPDADHMDPVRENMDRMDLVPEDMDHMDHMDRMDPVQDLSDPVGTYRASLQTVRPIHVNIQHYNT